MNVLDRVKAKNLEQECVFTASRSSGAGGQNVNKVNTKVSLRFDVRNSLLLNEAEKDNILHKLASKISGEGIIVVTAQTHRSQVQNKEAAILKFHHLIAKAFTVKKIRKVTRPSKAAIKKRLDEKRQQSEKKERRRKN
jgi:ribosome-associated protein